MISLVKDTIEEKDIDELINWLKTYPRLTKGPLTLKLEEKWSNWLGVKYSVFVNSGSSANLITFSVLKELFGKGEVIVPALTWISDIASLIHNGFKPVFVDINPKNLCMDENQVLKKMTEIIPPPSVFWQKSKVKLGGNYFGH